MREYKGRVELLNNEGDVLQEVRVFLRSQKPDLSGLGEWGGEIERSEITLADWDDTTQIRLSDGRTGEVQVTKQSESQGVHRGWLVGSGECPF